MGRRKKIQTRPHCVRSYLSDSELERVNSLALNLGMNVSMLIKKSLLNPNLIPADSTVLLADLQKIGAEISLIRKEVLELKGSKPTGVLQAGEDQILQEFNRLFIRYLNSQDCLEQTLRRLLTGLNNKN